MICYYNEEIIQLLVGKFFYDKKLTALAHISLFNTSAADSTIFYGHLQMAVGLMRLCIACGES